MMETILLGLDWHPTPLHAGIFAAANASTNYRLEILSPEADNYTPAPLEKLKSGMIDLAIVSPEALYQNPDILALAAMQQPGASLFLVQALKQSASKIQYGHYGIPYEKALVASLVKSQQWEAAITFHEETPQLSLWDAFVHGKLDMLWVFRYWEYLSLQHYSAHHAVEVLELDALGIPYPYTPVLVTRSALLQTPKKAIIKQLMVDLEEQYYWICHNPDSDVSHPALSDKTFVKMSFDMAIHYFMGADGRWGSMQQSIWDAYSKWLIVNNIITEEFIQEGRPRFIDTKQL